MANPGAHRTNCSRTPSTSHLPQSLPSRSPSLRRFRIHRRARAVVPRGRSQGLRLGRRPRTSPRAPHATEPPAGSASRMSARRVRSIWRRPGVQLPIPCLLFIPPLMGASIGGASSHLAGTASVGSVPAPPTLPLPTRTRRLASKESLRPEGRRVGAVAHTGESGSERCDHGGNRQNDRPRSPGSPTAQTRIAPGGDTSRNDRRSRMSTNDPGLVCGFTPMASRIGARRASSGTKRRAG